MQMMQTIAAGGTVDVEMTDYLRVLSERKGECLICLSTLRTKRYSLSPSSVKLLRTMYEYLVFNNNRIDLSKLPITYVQRSTVTILRFHGLVTKYKENGKHVPSTWLITRRGAQFMRNEITIPKFVMVYRNKVVGHDENRVSIIDVLKYDPKLPVVAPFSVEQSSKTDIDTAEEKRASI